ncbi:MAG: nitroreductase family protein, partial [Holophagales bacterium]|nr:nitroreductase family protein [Holophagales bacterium]
IELGEIEAALLEHPRVSQAVVTAEAVAGSRERRLAAYVVCGEEPAGGAAGMLPAEDVGEVLTDAGERLRFKLAEHARRRDLDGRSLELPTAETPRLDRRSVRRFEPTPLALEDLAGLLAHLRRHESGGLPRYSYASAGGLYPLQVYLWLAAGRVRGLEQGFYYYDPTAHRLIALPGDELLPPELHFPNNRRMAEESAFTVLLIADLAAIAPLYGHRARDFCLLEAGLMTQLLESSCLGHGLGLCQVGGLLGGDDLLRSALRLGDDHLLCHMLVGGLPAADAGGETEGGAPSAVQRRNGDPSQELRAFLGDRLPAYMVPATLKRLERLPLTANGKVDVGALASSTAEEPRRRAVVPPSGELERRLAALCAEVLELDEVGVSDNFFELGAKSIAIVQLYSRVRKELGLDLPVTAMFENPSIRALATFLEQRGEELPEERFDASRERAAKRRQALRARRRPRSTRRSGR